MKRRLLGLACSLFVVAPVWAGDVDFIEDFALGRDRGASLRQLIPGTEDYYYYHALHLLNTEQYAKAEELTRPWLQRFGQTQRLTEIQTRHALLSYERNPQRSLQYLRDRLGLRFDHQRVVPGAPLLLPTTLEAKLIARDTLRTYSFTHWQNLDNFEDSALDWLAAEKLDWERRRHLLQRLSRPDLGNLPELIVEDLQAKNPQAFGAFGIHRQLTLAQLEELLKRKPDLLNQTALIQTWLVKLHPGADENWRQDRQQTRAYLQRLEDFVTKLAPAHNALKAHVLYHRLALDRALSVYDKARFLAYLRVPRQQPYMAKVLLDAEESRRFPADLNANFAAVTQLSPVGSDEELVRSYLKHFFLTAASPKEFEPFINDVYLKHLFAEVKIEHGLGEPEQWASQLPPEQFRQLKERIDIDFAFTNQADFAADELVKLDLFVKNVPTLIVKVFEINTVNYYRTQRREVDTDINLDGLVANAEQTHPVAEPPLRRVAKRFEFPQLKGPGVYVIDFIGGGKSSRALIRKGRLRPLARTGSAGQVITVVDEGNRLVKDATVWLGGQEFAADKSGTITLPFSTAPGRQPIVLSRGDFGSLDYLEHQAENYHLAAGIHVDRESLLTQRVAQVLVRPGLFLNNTPVSVRVLEEVKLRITSTDHAGIATSLEVPNFKLFEDRESIHEFRVPARLATLTISLQAKVKNLSQSKSIDLAAVETFALNEIERTDKIEDLHLARFGPDYVLELLGRTGEAKPDRAVRLALKHRDFKQPVQTTLKTTALGRVHLGPLPDIAHLTATGPEGTAHTWTLPLDRHTYRRLVHAKAGEVITLPYLGTAAKPSHAELALFELRSDVIRADRFDALAVKDGLLELRDLPPGDYRLWLKQTHEYVQIRVVDGPVVGQHVLGRRRELQLPLLKPVQIAAISPANEDIVIRLSNASPFTRVHVFATRYQPAFSAFGSLGTVRDAEMGSYYPAHLESVYLTGRNIGDEYRYILERRNQKKYPGNMLDRPGLLLNPWAVRSTETGEQKPEGGDEFRRRGTGIGDAEGPARSTRGEARRADFANLDFLADASAVLVNLVPDKEGVVRVRRKEIGPHAMIHVVAVDPLNTTYRSTTLPDQPARFVDLRLGRGLDPAGHFTQQKQVSVLPSGQPFVLADVVSSRFEAYDSLAKVYGLYATLSHDPKLAEFAFLLNWPTLKPEEKRTLYAKYACHELHFFLAQKDPAFFQTVVRPYLTNKKDKTFLDHWLLDDDLSDYLKPWHYSRLNTVERVLLARRIADEPPKTARHLNDLLRLQPPNTDRFLVLFDTAVKSGALGTEDALGLTSVKSRLDAPKNLPALAPARPGAGGGMGPAGGAAGRPAAPAMKSDVLESRDASTQLAQPPAPKSEAALQARPERSGAESLMRGKELPDQREGRSAGRFRAELDDQKDAEAEEIRLGQTLFGGVADGDLKMRKDMRRLYRRLDPTQEWAENNYYHLPIQQQTAGLVPVSPFWLDYARHDGKQPFLSRNLAEASRNFTEMVFALAVLDLPFEAGKHDAKFADGRMTLTPAGPVIAFHEEVRPVDGDRRADAAPLLISQNFYRHGDRFRDEDGEKLDKFLTGEFIIQTVYGGQIVVTNPTSARQKLTVLIQLPLGSIPVGNGQYTRSLLLDLEPYRTQTIDYLFYFPLPGRFPLFPTHVAKNEKYVAAAQPFTFDVVEKPTKLDTGSWDYISQNGTTEQVLAFLTRENVHALNLERIAFRLKDRDFFETVLRLLQDRHAYQPTLWSYGLYHNAVPVAREYLLHAQPIVAACGGPIVSPLLTIDPVARHQYEHLEYKPLVNARAHALGQRRQIVNAKLLEQYHRFLKLLSYKPQLDDNDLLAVTYYLLLQDRIDEAMTSFARVHPEAVATKVQYDYCSAYLTFFGDEPRGARTIAAKYAEHPVDRWRNAFAAILQQLDEAEGKGPQIADKDNQGQRQTQLAATEPGFEFTLDAQKINLTWQNVETARVNYYLMDVELLFSRNPFVQHSGRQFAAVRPNATRDVKLPAGQNRLAIPLPDDLLARNVLVEVTAGGKTRSLPYYANAMDVRLMENYGQLRVTEVASGKVLSKVYVKVYTRLADGQVKFHKDGYTDLRGRFDYATVSTPERQPAERFAILVLGDDRGATIREVTPPQQ